MDRIIELNEVSKIYTLGDRTFTALANVNLHILRGENITIVGKSGSGKSTLLNLIAGIDYPTAGEIKINGANIRGLNESELATWRGKNIGIVFQFFQLIPTLTILENILLAMELVNSINKFDRKKRALMLLERVGILRHCNKFPSALSGGEQQRAAIARAMANNPDILIADEPTGNLDSKTAASVMAIFNDLVVQGKTVIVVTHENIEHRVLDQLITLSDGEIRSNNHLLRR